MHCAICINYELPTYHDSPRVTFLVKSAFLPFGPVSVSVTLPVIVRLNLSKFSGDGRFRSNKLHFP